jgi:hypothetical protein
MSEHRPKLAVCAIFKNEAPFLLEWIAYHLAVGVSHFVLYDNDSTDGGTALVRGSRFADRVTIIHWPQRPGQLSAYRHFIDIFAPGFEWAAFIDLDEFLLPLDTASVPETLDRLSHAAAVLVHWRVFGPGDWTDRPQGLVIENYDRRAPDEFDMNRHVKSIVRCAELVDVTQNPHEFVIRGHTVNTAGQAVPNVAIQQHAYHEHLVINHYHTKSRADWQAKIARGNATINQSAPAYDAAMVEHFAAVCTLPDRTMHAFLPNVRALLGTAPAPVAEAPPVVVRSTEAPPVVARVIVEPAPLAVGRIIVEPPPTATRAPVETALAPTPAAPPIVEPPQVVPIVEPSSAVPPVETRLVDGAPGWEWRGLYAQQSTSALVFRDMSRPQQPWLAALRGGGAASIDPDFIVDEFGRIVDFASDSDARAACIQALATRRRLT